MIRFFLLSCGYLLAGLICYGQPVDCSNIGFEEGSFRGWERWTGRLSPYVFPLTYYLQPGSLHPSNSQYGHTIMSRSDGYDPNVKEKIPVVAPGSQHSIRIGDLVEGGYIDQLRTTFVVPAEKPLLRYQFAIVLQNPHHTYYQQPGFSFLLLTSAGDTISCGYYEAVATNQTNGFTYQEQDDYFDSLLYRNWTTNVLDLRAYVGQSLHLEITTHDCTEGGHFGYAYFDAQCLEVIPTATTFCVQQDTLMHLSAPIGFDRYRWSTGDTTATIAIKPQLGDTYWVDVESRAVLNANCQTQLRLSYRVDQLVVPAIQQVNLCAGEVYAVGDSIYRLPGTYRTTIRRTSGCDSTIITHLNWLPLISSVQTVTLCAGSQLTVGNSVYHMSGTYQTHIHRQAPLCDSLVITHLIVRQIDLSTLRDTLVMQGDSVQLIASGPPGTAYDYRWSPKDGLSCSTCGTTWAKPTQTTQYQVIARTSDLRCEAVQTVHIQVVPCTIALPNTFTPNGDGVNDVFTVLTNSCLGRVRQLTVYNRWGQVIFHQKNDSNFTNPLSWDGTFQGELVGTGVYTYRLTVELDTGKANHYSGALTLLR